MDIAPQASFAVSLGVKNPDGLDTTISNLMQVVVDNGNLSPLDNGILKDIEGVDLVPSNIGLFFNDAEEQLWGYFCVGLFFV